MPDSIIFHFKKSKLAKQVNLIPTETFLKQISHLESSQ